MGRGPVSVHFYGTDLCVCARGGARGRIPCRGEWPPREGAAEVNPIGVTGDRGAAGAVGPGGGQPAGGLQPRDPSSVLGAAGLSQEP